MLVEVITEMESISGSKYFTPPPSEGLGVAFNLFIICLY